MFVLDYYKHFSKCFLKTLQVTFTCEYDTTVQVASQNLTVNGATAIGATSATGSLVDGFQLSLWTDQNMTDAVTDDNLFIGE